jgi:hypothetical protein
MENYFFLVELFVDEAINLCNKKILTKGSLLFGIVIAYHGKGENINRYTFL